MSLSEEDRLNLKSMVKKSNVENTTEKIRNLKHSEKIRADVNTIVSIKKKYGRLDNKMQKRMIENKCDFLRTNYQNIYSKIMKETIDLGLLNNFLVILKKIEEGECDQHEASVEVGQILKQIYIDSAVKEGEISDKKYNKANTKKTRKGKSISWADYKKLNPRQNATGN